MSFILFCRGPAVGAPRSLLKELCSFINFSPRPDSFPQWAEALPAADCRTLCRPLELMADKLLIKSLLTFLKEGPGRSFSPPWDPLCCPGVFGVVLLQPFYDSSAAGHP